MGYITGLTLLAYQNKSIDPLSKKEWIKLINNLENEDFEILKIFIKEIVVNI